METQPGKIEDTLVGATVDGRFEVLSFTGNGHTGSVYKARHILLNRLVALKVLSSNDGVDQSAQQHLSQRFQQEAKLIAALSHPNIVRVFDFGVTPDGRSFLVMDWLSGEPLSTVLRLEKRLSPERALIIAMQICDALGHAHANGIIHRDLKPSNIMLVRGEDNREQVKLVDFGIAKILSSEGSLQLTQTGELFYSPRYMSPEQCIGRKLDCRSDIYSLGCVLYEMLTGSQPFEDCQASILTTSRLKEPPRPFSKLSDQPAISPQLETVIFKALATRPEDRFQSALEFHAALAMHKERPCLKQSFFRRKLAPSIRQPTSIILPILLMLITVLAGLALYARENPNSLPVLQFRYWLVTITSDPGDPRRLDLGLPLFQLLRGNGSLADAARLFLDLPPLSPAYLEKDPVRIATTYTAAAYLIDQQGRSDIAKDLSKWTIAIVQKKIETASRDKSLQLKEIAELARQRVRLIQLEFGSTSKQALSAEFNLVYRLQEAGEYEDACAAWKQAFKSYHLERAWKIEFGDQLSKIAPPFLSQKHYDEAIEVLTLAKQCYTNVFRQGDLNRVTAHLAMVYEIQGKTEQARKLLVDLANEQEKDLRENSEDAAYAYYQLGSFEYRRGRPDKAVAPLLDSLSVYKALNSVYNDVPGSAALLLAAYYKSVEKKAEFESLLADPFVRATLRKYADLGVTNNMAGVAYVKNLLTETANLRNQKK